VFSVTWERNALCRKTTLLNAVAWLRLLLAGVSAKARVPSRLAYVGFLVNEVALRQVILRVPRFYPVTILPLFLHTHLHLNTTVIRKRSGRSLGTFRQSNNFSDIGYRWTERCFHIVNVSKGSAKSRCF
jgi:hypothetical protein